MDHLLVLGCGYAGTAVARLARARGMAVTVHVRRDDARAELAGAGFDVALWPVLGDEVAQCIHGRTHVVIAFPPDGETDARLAALFERTPPQSITYLSTTGVYGLGITGRVDESTPLPTPLTVRARVVVQAEDAYRALGATVLRCAAIYGHDRGAHVRMVRGNHVIAGDGTRYVSRVHVDDLAQAVLAAPASSARGGVVLIGDNEPATHLEVARFVSETYGVPMPPHVPLEAVHESLRSDRRVDNANARAWLHWNLMYPTYREGMRPAANTPDVSARVLAAPSE